MKKTLLLILAIISTTVFAQDIELKKIVGKYSDEFGGFSTTELELKDDYSFYLKLVDPIFPYTFENYENHGEFKIIGNQIILNPDLRKRKNNVIFNQKKEINLSNSVIIEINYFVKKFKNEEFTEKEKFDFDLLTIFINNKKRKYNIVQNRKIRKCSFAPRVKKQVVIDSSKQIKIKEKNIERIGVYTYGFEEIIWFEVNSSQSNKFQFLIEQPIDLERMPRSKIIEFKNDKAFFYERNGKIDKSLLPLKKKKE